MSNDIDRLKQSQEAKRAELERWRKSIYHDAILPSGLKVVLHDVDMTDIMLNGRLPDSILDAIEGVADKEKVDLKGLLPLMKNNGQDFLQFMNAMVKAAVIEPVIADEATDLSISLKELSGADKNFIMEWVNRETPTVKSFREGEAESVANVELGERLREVAE